MKTIDEMTDAEYAQALLREHTGIDYVDIGGRRYTRDSKPIPNDDFKGGRRLIVAQVDDGCQG